MSSDVRWRQRFENFQKAFNLLNEVINLENPDIFPKGWNGSIF